MQLISDPSPNASTSTSFHVTISSSGRVCRSYSITEKGLCVCARTETNACCFMCCLIIRKTAIPQRYHPASFGDETEGNQTGRMKIACQAAPNRAAFD